MKAFVVMPFDDEIADDLYRMSTKPICEEIGLEVVRADEIFTANPILDDILNAIEEATVIIADISGKNPNVFYELGMSHMLKKPQTVMITHDAFERVPFDVSHFRIIKYENTISGKVNYEEQLKRTLKNILRDYRTIYKNEFEVIINVMVSSKQTMSLYILLALAKSPKPLGPYEKLVAEGHNSEISDKAHFAHFSLLEAISGFVNMGYAQISGDIVVLTEKGKAFVELLEEKGFVLDVVNEHRLTSHSQ